MELLLAKYKMTDTDVFKAALKAIKRK